MGDTLIATDMKWEDVEKRPSTHDEENYILDGTDIGKGHCDGEEYWDDGLEGYCCTKCDWNTSIK